MKTYIVTRVDMWGMARSIFVRAADRGKALKEGKQQLGKAVLDQKWLVKQYKEVE